MAATHKEQMELVGARMLKEQREEFEQTLERMKRNHSQQLLAHEEQHQENIKVTQTQCSLHGIFNTHFANQYMTHGNNDKDIYVSLAAPHTFPLQFPRLVKVYS